MRWTAKFNSRCESFEFRKARLRARSARQLSIRTEEFVVNVGGAGLRFGGFRDKTPVTLRTQKEPMFMGFVTT